MAHRVCDICFREYPAKRPRSTTIIEYGKSVFDGEQIDETTHICGIECLQKWILGERKQPVKGLMT